MAGRADPGLIITAAVDHDTGTQRSDGVLRRQEQLGPTLGARRTQLEEGRAQAQEQRRLAQAVVNQLGTTVA